MNHLDSLENQTIYILREAYARFRNIALLWSMGKDSTSLLWMCRKAFFGQIPFPVLHIDTTYKFKEIYDFKEEISKKWNLNLLTVKNEKALAEGMNHTIGRFECCHALKTQALQIAVERHGFKALVLAIRRDEHGIRAKERYFSPRDTDLRWDYQDQPPELWDMYHSRLAQKSHFRIHPLLHWREIDVWKYTKRERLPLISLYLAKNNERYRSIGCRTCCAPVPSDANTTEKIIKELEITRTAERSGRAQDKEDAFAMQKLRSLGYM